MSKKTLAKIVLTVDIIMAVILGLCADSLEFEKIIIPVLIMAFSEFTAIYIINKK